MVYIKVSEDEILERLSQRWICRHCQTPYNAVNSPPRVRDKCDKCGGELQRRPDDTAELVKKRLEVYFRQTAPLVDWYREKGVLMEVDGEQAIPQVQAALVKAIEGASCVQGSQK